MIDLEIRNRQDVSFRKICISNVSYLIKSFVDFFYEGNTCRTPLQFPYLLISFCLERNFTSYSQKVNCAAESWLKYALLPHTIKY